MGEVTMSKYLEMVQTGLVNQMAKNHSALPAGFQKDRFVLNCITMLRDMTADDKKRHALSKVTPTSIVACFMKGAVLGLDFFNGECYAIPYGEEMKFQTDYKGEIKLNKKYSKNPIRDIYAKVVREGDIFYEEINGGEQNIYFKPVPFSDSDMIGAFAVVKYKDGSMQYETMSKHEIEKIRDSFSKASNSKAWRDTPGEMYKKTVLRRLVKFIDLDFDNVEQMKAYEDGGDAEFKENVVDLAESRPVNVFEKPKAAEALPQKKEPVSTPKVAKAKEPVKQDVDVQEAEFEQFDAEFVPDMTDELPFR